jgi:Required for nuclear transport of RNA pol II C-terminus 2
VPLRVSAISLLGTIVEAAPVAISTLGFGDQLAGLALELLQVETQDPRSAEKDPEKELSLQDDALALDTSLPQLRRAALLLLQLLVGGSRHQAEAFSEERAQKEGVRLSDETEGLQALRMPGGSVLPTVSGAKPKMSSIDEPPTLLLGMKILPQITTVCGYVQAVEEDEVAQQQARDCVEDVKALELAILHAGIFSTV